MTGDNNLPLQTWNWDLQLNMPAGIGDTREMMIRCTGTQVPGSQIEQTPLEAHGVKVHYAGRRTWTGTWTATFFETRDSQTRNTFNKWLETTRSWSLNSGTYKSIYAATALLIQYDDIPIAVKETKLFGVFPTAIDDVQLDQASGVVMYSVTFSYDYTD